MATRKLNMMIEVDEQVYNLVVLPHKKQKTFSKLIASLLNGYVNNMYIRGFADDTLDSMHKASVSALEGIIGDMHESLANMGMYTEELNNTLNDGIQTFSESAEASSEKANQVNIDDILGDQGFGSFGLSTPAVIPDKTGTAQFVQQVVKEENAKLKDEVESLKEQNSAIMEMLNDIRQNILLGNIKVPNAVSVDTVVESTPKEEKVVNTEKVVVFEPEKVQSNAVTKEEVREEEVVQEETEPELYADDLIGSDDMIEDVAINGVEEEEDEEEETVNAVDAMASLLSGSVFSF